MSHRGKKETIVEAEIFGSNTTALYAQFVVSVAVMLFSLMFQYL